ncbi:hypothetical protein R1flu_018056 [Riccia fluitans]|uniref:Ribosome-binding factor A n=1 Tax=Riccia fluitans TaxID=41844 RepID=A0ABD1ZEQ5_9MARC
MHSVLEARLRIPCAQASQLPQISSATASVRFCNDAHGCSTSVTLGSSSFFTGSRMRLIHQEGSVDSTGSSSTGLQVVSMARERRIKMVSQQIKREISEMLLYDKVLQEAVLPESALGADMYLTSVASISEVEMSKDLSVAKVYISIYGDERGQDMALAALKNRAGYVRKGIAQRMNLKFTPEIRFFKDEALERGSRVISLLEKLKAEREEKEKRLGVRPVAEIEEDDEPEEGEMEDEEVVEEEDDTRKSRSPSVDDGDETDWVEKDENITFIR